MMTVPANGLPMAIHFVETLEQTLREDRDRFTLSESLLRDSLARAYAWVGRAYMADGQLRRAQSYLLKSLRTVAWQPRQLVCLAAVSLPPKAFALLRRFHQKVKNAYVACM